MRRPLVECLDVRDERVDGRPRHEAVHERMESEGIVGAGRETEIQRDAIHEQSVSCAAIAASLMRHARVSRLPTMLLTPRTSPTGTLCRWATWATAAPSIFSTAPPVRPSIARAPSSVPVRAVTVTNLACRLTGNSSIGITL